MKQTFGMRLRLLRIKAGLTQSDLARRVGSDCNQVCRYESGQNRPRSNRLDRIANELGVSSEYLRHGYHMQEKIITKDGRMVESPIGSRMSHFGGRKAPENATPQNGTNATRGELVDRIVLDDMRDQLSRMSAKKD